MEVATHISRTENKERKKLGGRGPELTSEKELLLSWCSCLDLREGCMEQEPTTLQRGSSWVLLVFSYRHGNASSIELGSKRPFIKQTGITVAARMNCKQPVEELLVTLAAIRRKNRDRKENIHLLPPTAFKSFSTISLLLEEARCKGKLWLTESQP